MTTHDASIGDDRMTQLLRSGPTPRLHDDSSLSVHSWNRSFRLSLQVDLRR